MKAEDPEPKLTLPHRVAVLLVFAWASSLLITPALGQNDRHADPTGEFEAYALPAAAPAGAGGGVDPSLFPPLGAPPGMGGSFPPPGSGVPADGFQNPPSSPAPPVEDADGWVGKFPELPQQTGTGTIGGGLDPSLLPPLQAAPKTGGGPRIPPPLVASGLKWQGNPYLAAKAAKKNDRYLLLVFGGWDWNPQTDQLSWEVFATGEFQAYAKRWFEVGFLHYARNPNENHDHLMAFKEAYNIRGYPSVVIFTPEGVVVHRENGYRKGQPVLYLGRLQSAIAAAHEERMAQQDELRKTGFRTWTGVSGGTLFAKAFALSEAGVHLVDMTGQRYRIAPANMSDEDLQVVAKDASLRTPPTSEDGTASEAH